MIVSIISIGNSKGIRIPKPLLLRSKLSKDVELRVKPGEIKIVPLKKRKSDVNLLALASESSFTKDWLKDEEDKAWTTYQSAK